MSTDKKKDLEPELLITTIVAMQDFLQKRGLTPTDVMAITTSYAAMLAVQNGITEDIFVEGCKKAWDVAELIVPMMTIPSSHENRADDDDGEFGPGGTGVTRL